MKWILSTRTLSLPQPQWQQFLEGKKPTTVKRYERERRRYFKRQTAGAAFEPKASVRVVNYQAEKKTKVQQRRKIQANIGRMFYPPQYPNMFQLINAQFKIMWSRFAPLKFVVLKAGFDYFIKNKREEGGVMTPVYIGESESFELALESLLNRLARFITVFSQSVAISAIYLKVLEIDSFGGWEAKPKR